MPKTRIIEELGERELLLPGLVADALAANERVKYLLTLLQTAGGAADGARGLSSLSGERVASGVEDESLDAVVAGSRREGQDWYRIPGAERVARAALRETRLMLAPLLAAQAAEAGGLAARADAVEGALELSGDRVRARDIRALCEAPGHDRDSLHVVVMDAHKALNALQARTATETVEGAAAHNLTDPDRALVRAFMGGLHSTERLRLDHPGLGTIAMRTGASLILQNDLGETDAHVVVIKVRDLAATITYTDVHLQRLLFFQSLLPERTAWEDTRSRSGKRVGGELYHLASGRLQARDEQELERFLARLGSRLVFLIDWNRARKRLRRLVGRGPAIELLRWSAEQEYGHVAFLRAGADGLVYDALEFAGGRLVRPGESLQDVLGTYAAVAALRSVMRICSTGLQAGQPVSLVQDEVRAELTRYLRSARQELLALALRHAELSVEIVEAARDGVEQAILGSEEGRGAAAARARSDEHEADQLLSEARAAAARVPELEPVRQLLEAADDIADCAEEAAFYATLLPLGHPAGEVREQVRRIAALVLDAARQYLRAVGLSSDLRRGGQRAEIESFLQAAHRTIALEHETDDAQRAVHRALSAESEGSGIALFVIVQLTRSFEEAADALMHSAHLLREHALSRVSGSEAVGWREEEPAPAVSPSPVAGTHSDLFVMGEEPELVPSPQEIGAKAHGLARLARARVRVPEAVVMKTSLARGLGHGMDESAGAQERLTAACRAAVAAIEARTRLRLGSRRSPLVLSVRSGAPVSMPGMLETVLDVGLCDTTVAGLIALTGNPRLAWDSYRRLVEGFATVVHGCPREPFAQALREAVAHDGVRRAQELGAGTLERLARAHLDRFAQLAGRPFPQDPAEQVRAAVQAVMRSWEAPKAREYRRIHAIPEDLGTAVILQRMVFGNAGGMSGAGVGFTRDPAVGEPGLYLDFLFDAQGEDVVAGRHTVAGGEDLAVSAPALLEELRRLCPTLEGELRDAQEFEFTVQDGEVFVLQARRAKRTPWAALRIACDQVREGLIGSETALERLSGLDLETLVREHVQDGHRGEAIALATPASVGVATGPLALDRAAAERLAAAGPAPVLVRPETTTEDLPAVAVSAGLLTAAGSRTSHAAVVARELGKPCLVGCQELRLDTVARTAGIGGRVLREGETICLDAESGLVFAGAPPIVQERPERELAEVAAWRAAQVDGPPVTAAST